MQFKTFIKYPLVEEAVFLDKVVFKIETTIDSLFTIIPDSFDSPLNLLRMDADTGICYLTETGVNYINNAETNFIKVQVQASQNIGDDKITPIVKTCTFEIIKVHDEIPNIIDDIRYPLYSSGLKVNSRLQEIKTEYSSHLEIIQGNTLVKLENNRVILKLAGLNFIQLPANIDNLFSYIIKVTDTNNNKSINIEVNSPIINGSSIVRTKPYPQLSSVADTLTTELSSKFSQSVNASILTDLKFSSLNTQTIINKQRSEYLGAWGQLDQSDYIEILRKEMDFIRIYLWETLQDIILNQGSTSENIYKNLSEEKLTRISKNISMDKEIGRIKAKASTIDNKLTGINNSTKKFIINTNSALDNKFSILVQELTIAINEGLINAANELNTFISDVYSPAISTINTSLGEHSLSISSNKNSINTINTSINTINQEITSLENEVQKANSMTLESIGGVWDFNGSGLYYNGRLALSASGSIGNLSLTGSTFGNPGYTFIARTFQGTATKAKYADLAEYYTSEVPIPSGLLVDLNVSDEPDQKDYEVVQARGHSNCIGVSSTSPGFILNSDLEGSTNTLVALQGRVPVKCTSVFNRGWYVYQNKSIPSYTFLSKSIIPGSFLLGRAVNYIDEKTIEIKLN